MTVFTIGRNGNQPFPIQGERVSSEHARVTIDEQGRWLLEDLNSSNGTYIYDSSGRLIHIRRKEIDEYTRIVLADATPMGATFYAHHLLEHNKDEYRSEFKYLLELYGRLHDERQRLEHRIKQRRIWLNFIPGLVSCLIGLLMRVVFPDDRMLLIAMMSASTTLLSLLVSLINNSDNRLRLHVEKMQRLVTCPKCGRPLSDYDLTNQLCPACKSHA